MGRASLLQLPVDPVSHIVRRMPSVGSTDSA